MKNAAQRITTGTIQQRPRYEVMPDRTEKGGWRVEALDYANEGDVYVALFMGQGAEQRARQYADWMNG